MIEVDTQVFKHSNKQLGPLRQYHLAENWLIISDILDWIFDKGVENVRNFRPNFRPKSRQNAPSENIKVKQLQLTIFRANNILNLWVYVNIS